ncbi:tryptamine hydroxycinnamoyltransferase 2-like [Telopea speciosissima]|uniref:tryptamine hydroxycinnamoyltransferase 2-like n=1 Tax=Telopea speciosissima TaxID=54955 RepID=UPI001CC6B00D|nr:tryptamine hydroxycinnamoyltransferase 2-like [Telopea speciosissima]
MAIDLIRNTILKPPSSSDADAVVPRVPLTIFDQAAFDLHVAVLYAFRPPMPSNEALKEGLSKALFHYPHLAGRLTTDQCDRPAIILNNAGIRIIETFVSTTLADQLPFTPSTDLTHLLPPTQGVEELLQIQLNRYACGGLVIGQTAHHHVADGQSMSSFFIAWAKLVRGLPLDPLPYHDRSAVSVPRNPPSPEFDHRRIEFRKCATSHSITSLSSIANIAVHFSADFIANLKVKVNEGGKHRYSAFECLLSHMWKKVTMARGLAEEEWTQVRVAVNGRARMKPPVAMEYFGNLVLWAYPKLRVGELLKESHKYVAKAIHEAVAKLDSEYFQSFVDFGEMAAGKEKGGGGGEEKLVATAPEVGTVMCPNLEVDSWLRFEFHDLDFGGGGPVALLPPNMPVEGLIIFVPSSKEGGGMDVFVALLHEHVQLFKQISHSLD